MQINWIKYNPENKKQPYSFIAMDAMLDYDDLLADLSREHPLAFIEQDDLICGVLIHKSLLRKAEVCSLAIPKSNMVLINGNLYLTDPTKNSVRQEFIEWAKRIKAAPWPKDMKRQKYNVIFPTI